MMERFRSALFSGEVVHQRTRPRRHQLRYRIFYLALDLDEAAAIDSKLRLFSMNRFNLFSVHDRDHGDGSATPLARQARNRLRDAGVEADGAIVLLTLPRILGYAFNPLSIFFCHSRDGALAAILYEVNNTFGQRHFYLIPAKPDGGGLVRQESEKSLYVSPFLDADLRYAFVVSPPGERVFVSVTASDSEGPLLLAKLSGRRRPLDDASLLRAFFAYPLLTVKVIAAIHWEAARLLIKGVRLTKRPVQRSGATTVGRPAAPGDAPRVI